MTSRFTQTEKWDDAWFRQLSPNAKVLYWYIWDKCNIAGFWELDWEGMAFNTKVPARGLQGAYKELARGFIISGNYIWIRRFLYHQKNLPLNPSNPAHKGILRLIDEYKSIFPNILEELEKQKSISPYQGATKGLSSSLSISKGISKGKGKEEIPKKQYLDNVFMTEKEHSKLIERFGSRTTTIWIEKLDSYIGSKGRKYKSHYKTIISWSLKSRNDNQPVQYKPPPPNVGPDGKTPGQRLREKIEADSKELEGDE